jgi:hypothetical protein
MLNPRPQYTIEFGKPVPDITRMLFRDSADDDFLYNDTPAGESRPSPNRNILNSEQVCHRSIALSIRARHKA